jgi:hypothetical protein
VFVHTPEDDDAPGRRRVEREDPARGHARLR